jgi:hypothetical protein
MNQKSDPEIIHGELNDIEKTLFAFHHEHLGKIVNDELLAGLIVEADDEIAMAQHASNKDDIRLWRQVLSKHKAEHRYRRNKRNKPSSREPIRMYKQGHLVASLTSRELQDLILKTRSAVFDEIGKTKFTLDIALMTGEKLNDKDFMTDRLLKRQEKIMQVFEIEPTYENHHMSDLIHAIRILHKDTFRAFRA